jgi:outer membrane receptor protein involved in Fe transport
MSLKFVVFAALVLSAIILGTSSPAGAQLTRGTISGTVTDMTEAAILGVQVTIRNLETGIDRETVSNEFGVYRFPALEPGRYSVEFKLEGFQDRKVESIEVSTSEEIVVNQSLELGVLATEVTVVTAPSGIDIAKADATIASTLDQRVIQELPITALARDVTRLALLAPTVSRAPGSNEFSANGQRARNNNFMIDGTDNNDIVITVDVARILPEAVAEVKVQTTPYSAEFGRSSGAQVQAITRNGSNEFHGEAWDYYRGNWMQPVTLTNKRAGIKETPRFVQHQFGGSFAGPIVRNRTFFFGLLDRNIRRESPDARNATPTNIPTSAGYAALQNVPLGPGQSLESRQAMLQALSFLPSIHGQVGSYDTVTTRVVNGVPIEIGSIRIPIANPRDYWYNVGRIDHQLTDKDNISYRYLLDHRNQPDITSNTQFGTKWTAARLTFNQNHAISYTRVFTPRFLNEFRTAYIRGNFDSPERDPKSSTVMITQLFTAGGLRGFPQARITNAYQWQDVGTYFLGRHSLKFGLDVRYNKLFNRSGTDAKGTWTFDNLQEFMNNRAFSLAQAVNEATFDAHETNQYYFLQDDIKATQDLTFNVGIRYDYSSVPLGFFGAANETIAAAGVPRPARPDKNNWAPRFGFAYSPANPGGFLRKVLGQGQSSIRGGFGVVYDQLFLNILANNASNYPRVLSSTTNQPGTINLFPTLAPKVATLPPFDPLATFGNATENIQNPTTHLWSLALSRQFQENYVLELGYTGNRSYHQLRQSQLNPAILTAQQAATVIQSQNSNSIPNLQARRLNPAWGQRITVESTAKGEYHAGYAKFDKKISNGLLFGASYTFSANFTDSDEPYGGNNVVISSPQVPQDYFNLRNEWSRSVFDRPHRLVVHYVYEIPWFSAGAANQPIMQQVFKGWQMSGSTEFESGQPFTIRTGVDSAGVGTTASARPNSNPAGILNKDPVTQDLRTFSIPLNGSGRVTLPAGFLANTMPGGGNLGRNTFRGPSFQNWNFSLMKTFTLWEQVRFQFRTDFINLWNHNNFQNPESVMNSASFGSNTATPITDSREVLFVGRIKF